MQSARKGKTTPQKGGSSPIKKQTKKGDELLTLKQREELSRYHEDPDQIIASAKERATKNYKTFINKNAPGLLDNIDYMNMLKQKIDGRNRDPSSSEVPEGENQQPEGELA